MDKTTPVGNEEFRNAKKYWASVATSSAHTLQNNEIRFAAKYSIILCTEASIQIGKHMLDGMQIPYPEKNADVFVKLADHRYLDYDLAKRLGRLARFRNTLVHDYAGVDIKRLRVVLAEDLKDVEEFQEIALKWERDQKGGSVISQMFEGAGVKTVLRSIFKW